MRTTPTLLGAKAYASGSPVYYGDPTRVYSSEIIISVNVSIVKSPDGGKVMTPADQQLTAAMQKLKFGQIGAVKSGVTVSSSETVIEFLVPVDIGNVVQVKESLVKALDLGPYSEKKQITVNNQPMTIDQVKDRLAQFRDSNREIRDRWADKSKKMRARGASSADIIQQKAAEYKEYVSVSNYSVAVGITTTHYVHKPALRGTVVENCNQQDYESYNYREGNVRKVATEHRPIVSIPIVTLGDRDDLLKRIAALAASSRFKDFKPLPERMIIEGSPFNEVQNTDFDALRKHDTSIVTPSK
jgi:hypothetical protein